MTIQEERTLQVPATMFHVIGDCNNAFEDVRYLISRRTMDGENENDYAILFLGNFLFPDENLSEMIEYLKSLFFSRKRIILLRGENETALYAHFYDLKMTTKQENIVQKFIDLPFFEEIARDMILILNQTKFWYENQFFIFSPAYLDLTNAWKKTDESLFFDSETSMISQKNKTGKKSVFGFYSSAELNAQGYFTPTKKDIKVWHDSDFTKYCLNGEPRINENGKVLALFIQDDNVFPISSKVGRKKPILDC